MLKQELQFSIIAKALDAGVFYQDHLVAQCEPAWLAAFPAVDARAGGFSGTLEVAEGTPHSTSRAELIDALKNAPRGTWASLSDGSAGAGARAFGYMSNGAGAFHSEYGGVMTYERLLRSMVSMEIFLARRAYAQHTEEQKARACITANGLRLNHTFRNVKVGGYAFSTAVIVGMRESGMLELICTRRGSARRYNAKVLAHRVERPDQPIAPRSAAAIATGELF
ncbi:hypothetical protein ACQHIH_21835 (plasmid) [Xanthomonas sontii]|uniref:hypothetical protein n=1 Tax=Xanthomonas sontii TaxID=2650745 RepID=UPI003F827B19